MPDRVTISVTKNNVWDRRINTRGLEAPTLLEITERAFSPANKGFEGKAVIIRKVGKTEPVTFQVDNSNGECLVFSTIAGHKYSIEAH